MKLKVTNYLTLELTEPRELIELVSEEDKIDFFQSLACEDVVIKYVSDQIIHGCTDDGYHGSTGCVAHDPSTPLDIATRYVAKNANDVARKQISSLERALKDSKQREKEWQEKYYDLYHGEKR